MSFFDNLKKAATTTVANAVGNSSKSYTFADIPTTLDAFQALPEAAMKDPFAVAALTVVALTVYPQDKDTAIAMLNFLKGPSPLSTYDLQFLRDRFSDKDYVPRSYFNGTSPANNYMPTAPFTVTVYENPHSRDQQSEGYLLLWLQSSGADSKREIKLRTKPSTGEWFLWEYQGLLGSIRIPAASNPWA